MFKRFYGSGWQHPGIAFIGLVPFVFAFALRQRFLLGWVAIFTMEILGDALFTGSLNPAAGMGLDSKIGVSFVILGDLRYFVVLEWIVRGQGDAEARGLGPPLVWAVAVPIALIVPIASYIPQLAWASAFDGSNEVGLHRIFILYEAMFFTLALVLRFVVLPRRLKKSAPALAAWALKLTHFELVQYGLWILSDALILATKLDGAYLLRAVPNTMYYVLFVPFVWWTAPSKLENVAA